MVNRDDLSSLDEELLFLFIQLPNTQKHIAIEYIRQQVEITNKAFDRQDLSTLCVLIKSICVYLIGRIDRTWKIKV